jgi:hypothetical protein
MEQLPGFGINSIIWEEREFLDGNKYYYSPALGQIRLNRPPVTAGGCVADEMGLGVYLGDYLVHLCIVISCSSNKSHHSQVKLFRCSHWSLAVWRNSRPKLGLVRIIGPLTPH